MADLWQLTFDVPDKLLVPDKRGGVEQIPCGLPAWHNKGGKLRHQIAIKNKQKELLRWVINPGPLPPSLSTRCGWDVLLIRLAPRPLDAGFIDLASGRRYGGDNGTSWAKYFRDGMAEWVFGLDDKDPRIRWHCGQQKLSKQHRVRIIVATWALSPWELPDRWLRGELC